MTSSPVIKAIKSEILVRIEGLKFSGAIRIKGQFREKLHNNFTNTAG